MKIALSVFILCILAISSCSMSTFPYRAPTESYEIPLQDVSINGPQGRTRVVFFNGMESKFWYAGKSSWVDIELDKKIVGTVKQKEYIQIFVEPAEYELVLKHQDFWYFKDTYIVPLTGEAIFIKTFNTPWQTKYEVQEELPEDFFTKFSSAKK